MATAAAVRQARVLALTGCCGLGATAWAWLAPNYRNYTIAMESGVVAAMAMAAAAAWWPERTDRSSRREALLLGGGVSLLCGALVWIFGHRQFGGFDHSVLIDLGWRQVSGQRPGVDFPSTLPIGFVLGTRYALQLFGTQWSAFIAWQAFLAVFTCGWSFALLRFAGESAARAALLAAAAQAGANIMTAYWWYNAAATTVAVVFFLSATCLWRSPSSRLAGGSYIASLVLLASMKPNVAGVLIVGTTLVLMASRPHRRLVVLYSGAGLVIFAGWLAFEGVSLPGLLRTYASIAGRGFSFAQFLQDLAAGEKLIAILLLSMALAPWVLVLRPGHQWPRSPWLGASAMLTGCYGFLVNGDNKFVDLPLLLLALWWIGPSSAASAAAAPDGATRLWRRYVGALATLVAVGGLTAGALRVRVRTMKTNVFFEYALSAAHPQTPFFARMEVGPKFITVEREVAEALTAHAVRQVFFGPRMQWAYAAFDRPSPEGQPVWWHRGVSYPDDARAEAAAVEAWHAARADLLIFLHGDFTYLPARMRQIVGAEYLPVDGFPKLDVFVRR